MLRRVFVFLLFATALAALGFSIRYLAERARYLGYEEALQRTAENLVKSLSDEELIGQLLLVYSPLRPGEPINTVTPGTIFIHQRNIPLKRGRQNLPALKQQIEAINRWYIQNNKIPPAYAIDQEGGHVKRLYHDLVNFTSPMAVHEASNADHHYAEDVGYYTCQQLRELGIQWNLAPIVDVQNNPENPVIRTRAFSSSPHQVVHAATAYLKGAARAHCITTLKHFPGHGDTAIDSHHSLPVIRKTANQLNQVELLPYRSLLKLKPQPPAIMSAHILFPEKDEKPATVSQYWLHDYLRTRLQYQGIIVTDDMAMNGIEQYASQSGNDAMLEALLAGADVLLYFQKSAWQAIELHRKIKSLLSGRKISRQALEKRGERVLIAKIRAGILNKSPLLKKFSSEEDFKLIQQKTVVPNFQISRARKASRAIARNSIKLLKKSEAFQQLKQAQIVYTEYPGSSLVKPLEGKFRLRRLGGPIANKGTGQPAIILNLDASRLKNWLRRFRRYYRGNLIVYSVSNPFPYSTLGGQLEPRDSLVVSFSDTPDAREALVTALAERRNLPMARVGYSSNSPLP